MIAKVRNVGFINETEEVQISHSKLSLSYAKPMERKVHSDNLKKLQTKINLQQDEERKVVEV